MSRRRRVLPPGLHASARTLDYWPDRNGAAPAFRDLARRHAARGGLGARLAAPRRRRGSGRLSLRHRLPRLAYRVVGEGAALRCRLWHLPYGDQGLFVRREVYGMIAGIPPLPLLEDVAFVRRLSRVGTLVFPPVRAFTSPRPWERSGILACTERNGWLLALYAFDRPPDQLARLYDEHPT